MSLVTLVCCFAPLGVLSCASVESDSSAASVARQAVEGADCGYSVQADVHGVSKKGFNAKIRVSNVDGIASTGFSVLIKAGTALLTHVAHGNFQSVENGYLLTPLDAVGSSQVDPGQTYGFELNFAGDYSKLDAYIITNNGVACDQAAPTVKLSASGDFFTADGSMTLSADATDNVALSKVVFSQDGVVIGTDTVAPYTLDVPITSLLNGRHRYSATAYDLTGNQASQTKRVLVAIGNKFFGSVTARPSDYTDFLAHFNQLTPGNAGKWGSVESTHDQMNWTDLDTAYAFAKANHIPFKLHTLVWGQQQPGWIAALAPEEQLAEIEEWYAALAARYPDVELIDVVNEPLHAPPSYVAALGGAGATGWDWVIKAFELARLHFPNAELILNDYSILSTASATQNYLTIVNLLKDRGLIDGIGEQGHFYERAPELPVFSANLDALAATGLPIYISELDLDFADDARQANRMKDLFTTMWTNPSVLGVTHWGHLEGNMWRTNAYLIRKDGTLRPALTWIECFKAGGTNCTVPVYVPQPRLGDNAGITIEAEEYDSAQGLLPAGNVIAYASNGSWVRFDKVSFVDNWNTLNVAYALGGSNTTTLTVHFDDVNSVPIASIPLAPTGGWGTMKTASIPFAPLSGQRNVILRFNGGGANVDKVQFAAPAGTGRNVISDSDFELGTIDGWSTWSTGSIANTTARAVSGTRSVVMTGRGASSPLANSLTRLVVPGKTYKVSLWATIGGAASATAYVTTTTQCSGGAASYPRLGGWSNTKTIVDGSWVEFTGDLVVPDCALANVGMWLEGPGAGVDLYVDHVSVRQQSSSNVIGNGTFESGTSGWYSWSGGVIASSTARVHGGAASLLLTRSGNAPAATDVTSVVKAGSNYPLSLWASVHTPDGSAAKLNVTQAASCKQADGTIKTTYSWIGGQFTVPDGATWTQFNGTLAVPACNLTQMQFWVEGAGPDQIYIDDVQLIDNSGGTTNLITDGTFETGQGAWGGWGYTTLSTTTTTAHAGAQSLMGAGLSQNAAVSRDIKSLVIAGKRYQATTWVSVSGLAAGSGLVKFQTVQGCNGTGDGYPWLAGATVNNGAWAQLSGVIDLSACSTIDKLQLFVGADSGNLYVDDVTLTAL